MVAEIDHQFEQWYETYRDRLYHYVWTLLGYNEQDALQVTSDVFVKLYRYVLTHEIEHPQALLYRIAHNEAENRKNKERGRLTALDDGHRETFVADDDVRDETELTFRQELLEQVMQRLTTDEQTLVYLRRYDQRAYDEISQILDMPINTVATRLRRVMTKMQ